MDGLLKQKTIDAAKPGDRLNDGRGLRLEVKQKGGWWRFRYRYAGKENLLSFGTYPEVSLKQARKKRDDARSLVADGVDPSAKRRAEKEAQAETFEAVAREWLAAKCPPHKNGKAPDPDTIAQLTRRLEKYVFPRHRNTPIKAIGAHDFHQTLKRIVAKDKIETAHRVRSVASRVFRYAVATGRAERDPAADLRDALPSVATTSFAAITEPKEIGALLRAIDGFQGQPATMAALKLAPYVFVRPGELRSAEWSEIDLKAAEWRIPKEKTKMDRDHLVPLSRQAVAILEDLKHYTGNGALLFPGIRSRSRPISENTINAALRRMGYDNDQMTGHGFRSMASTRLNELGFDPDLIEVQLAHMDKDRVRAIYNRIHTDSYVKKRKGMMQAWADYLDGLRADKRGTVTAIRA